LTCFNNIRRKLTSCTVTVRELESCWRAAGELESWRAGELESWRAGELERPSRHLGNM
jgi:hypothetical protein